MMIEKAVTRIVTIAEHVIIFVEVLFVENHPTRQKCSHKKPLIEEVKKIKPNYQTKKRSNQFEIFVLVPDQGSAIITDFVVWRYV